MITFFLMILLAHAENSFNRVRFQPVRGAVTQQAVEGKPQPVPFGPEPSCGGTKAAGDRWCY